nr:uncharacterized protein LOC122273253 [Parasteatoda tepidariorum]
MFQRSPGVHSKRSEERRVRKRQQTEARRKLLGRKRLFHKTTGDAAYGVYAERPDLNDEDYSYKKDKFLAEINIDELGILEIEKDTRGQQNSARWMLERKKRLTASNFGVVCNKLPTTKCDTIIKKLLYFDLSTEAMRYGKRHEVDAINALQNLNHNVSPCGLFIDKDLPFLAASPDGLVGNDGIIEVKCPAKCYDITPDEGILSRKVTFWKVDKTKKNILGINTNHIFYYQVQGQLHITRKSFCLFVLWTPKGIKIENIKRDDEFWENKMEQKLKNFYFDCLLPEIIDPRFTRSLPIRNPQYIVIAAINEKNSKITV